MPGRGVIVAIVLTVAGCVPPPPGPPPSTCAPAWSTAEQRDDAMSGAPIVNVRAGVHRCFDRLVVDLAGPVGPGYTVHYVDVLTQLASGEPIPLRGAAFLEVIVRAPAIDENGISTYPRAGQSELVDVAGFGVFRQIAWGGYQEGITQFGVGLASRQPFDVTILPRSDGTTRLVIDVAHR